MLFKTDENLPAEVADLLIGAGFDCLTAHGQGLAGEPDSRVSDVCQAEGRILVTLDLGFANILAYPPDRYPGFVVFRLSAQDTPYLLAVATRLIGALRDQRLQHELWIVEDNRIRRRK